MTKEDGAARQMTPPDLMTRPEAAEYLRTPIATLAQWASKNYGPRFIKAGRRTLYPRAEVERFIEEQMAAGTRPA